MSNSKIYKIIYLEQDLESVTTLKRIIRSQSVKSDFVIDITSINILSQAVSLVEAGDCDLILLRDSPNLPSLTEVFSAIEARDINIVSIVNEGKIDASQDLYTEGAILVTSLVNPEVFYKQIIGVLFLRSLKTGYRSALDKNRELIERSSGLLSSTNNMIAYVKDGLFLFANNAFLENFGFDRLETLQRTLFLDLVSSKDVTKFKTLSKKVLVSGKEVPLSASFKNSTTQKEMECELVLKKTSYEGEVCLELFIGHEHEPPSVTKITSETGSLNNRQIFFNVLPSFVETSSWLICIVIEEYIALRKKHGVILLESYVEGVVEQLKEQLKDLHIVRYSDQSLLMLMPNSDMTSVDRIGTAITSSAKNFIYTVGDASIESNYHFTYTSLGNNIDQIAGALKTIDKQAKLLQTIAVVGDSKSTIDQAVFTNYDEPSDDKNEAQEETIEVEIRDDEFAPLQKNINSRSLRINYLPIADFSQGDCELYLMNYELLGEDGKIFYWNKSFASVSHNAVVQQLDELFLEHALKVLENEPNKKIIIDFSMNYLMNPKNLVEYLKRKDPKGSLHKQVVFGFSVEAFLQHTNRALQFFNELKKNKFSTCIYGVSDILDEQLTKIDAHADYISLAANYIGRLSRGGNDLNPKETNALLSDLKSKNIQVLAEGVDSPSHMAMVWEYNIPLATGNMVSGARERLDFDFSQIMI